MAANRPFALLDRDGTIIVERHYLADPQQVELLPGAAEGMKMLQDRGIGLVLVTNQSGIGRGYFDLGTLKRIHARLVELLAAEEVVLDGIFFCPHKPDNGCDCRKPAQGMVRRAVERFGFAAAESFVIGDNEGDIELGRRAGATTFLVRTGYGERVEKSPACAPDFVVDDVLEAAHNIVRIVV